MIALNIGNIMLRLPPWGVNWHLICRMAKEDFLGDRIRKEDYARALRCYQAAHEETKSESRKRFEKRLAQGETLDDIFDRLGVEELGRA